MQGRDNMRERKALEILLEVGDSPQKPRYRANHTEPSIQGRVRVRQTRMGKENQGLRRQMLPKLNNSKEQLKLILQKLQEPSHESSKEKEKKVGRKVERCSQTCAMKSGRSKNADQFSSVEQTKRKENQGKSILEIGRGDNLHALMRQHNYSTNALNLKTLNILQQINSKSYGLRQGNEGKGRRNVVAFLRRVA